ncbi:primase-helicase family protein [Thioclava sp. F28-4]|uniref:primase-helicase family protein n=1 Tax=Thioclava sp. F28-4 TaxID=1915315 RepID=UPI00143B31B3|nr:primase-helicase family protein [Thioclava sp. F28-4]
MNDAEAEAFEVALEEAGLSEADRAKRDEETCAKVIRFDDWINENDPSIRHLARVKMNDALVFGDLGTPEAQAVLALPVVVGLTNSGPRVSGDKWAREAADWGSLLQVLTMHPVTAKKGGNALFFAESALTGKKRADTPLCYRLKDKIERVFAVAIDVDGGCTAEGVMHRLRARNLFAVIYTTHSHSSKGARGSDRFRVILPLSEPFALGEGVSRKDREAEWESLYVGLITGLMPKGADWDFTASRPSQMMHAPARPKGADFKHFVIAGAALDLSTVTPGDAGPYRKKGPSGLRRGGEAHDGTPAYLADGFDLMAWHADHGENFLLSNFIEWIGWDVLGDAGDGFDTICPNFAAHSEGSGETAWAIDGPESKSGAAIFCHHDHCAGLYTWDFLKLLEAQCPDLPDGFETLSELICAPELYAEAEGSETPNRADYIEDEIKLFPHKTPKAVQRAFEALPANAGEDHLAAIFGGIVKGGGKANAQAEWGKRVKGRGVSANDLKRIEKRGRELLDGERKEYAAEKAEERSRAYADALDTGTPANHSLDPAEPLGDDMETALATLRHRYAPCDLGGKFRIVRKPDLGAFTSAFDSTIAVYQKEDFLNLHLDRQIMEGESLINPAKIFLETEKRKSGIIFAPPPAMPGANDFNTYQGRTVTGAPGEHGDARDFPVLRDFMLRVICDGDEDKLAWLTLWMAHLVQHPGEKPGTAVIAVGDGGIGKGRFGALLSKLALPHFKQLENEAHVIGQFAGEHLSKCVLVQVNEAVFGASPKVSSALKALIDSTAIPVEAKGMSAITVPSFTRFYFDSNDAVPVLIEGNGSERRYFVLKVNAAEKGNTGFFDALTRAIEGQEMGHFLAYLETYDPASAGLSWADVRTAPETPERRVMAWHSMRPAVRALLDVLRDGEVTLKVDGLPETFTANGDGLRVPVAGFRDFIKVAGNKNNAEDSDVAAMVKQIFGIELETGQGKVGSSTNTRWWHFPPEVLGENVDRALRGE